jgi:hypothetical protein
VGYNSQGIWRYRGGAVEKVVRFGVLIREVALLEVGRMSGNEDGYPSWAGDGGHVAFQTTFWSGHEAIVVHGPNAPTSVPALAGEGGGAIAGRVSASPNPCRGSTSFRFTLARTADVAVEIFDVTGRRVFEKRVLGHPAGDGAIAWDATNRDAAPGAGFYAYRVSASGASATGKVIVVR